MRISERTRHTAIAILVVAAIVVIFWRDPEAQQDCVEQTQCQP